MEQFSLEKWLKNSSRKVVTRDGREVEILKTDFRGYKQIVGVIKNSDKDDEVEQWDRQGSFRGLFGESKCDLFFADKEDELTKFEKELNRIVISFSDAHAYMDEIEIHHYSKELLEFAKEEFLKEFPKLEKTKNHIDPTIPIIYTNAASMKSYVEYDGYKVCINELFDKLLKEE